MLEEKIREAFKETGMTDRTYYCFEMRQVGFAGIQAWGQSFRSMRPGKSSMFWPSCIRVAGR